MVSSENDRIKCYVESYLYFFTEADIENIVGYLRKGPFSFVGGAPSKQKVSSLLAGSSLFLTNKTKDGRTKYRLAKE